MEKFKFTFKNASAYFLIIAIAILLVFNYQQSVLICVINKHQIIELKNILKNYDKTFSFVETVNETVGNFKLIK